MQGTLFCSHNRFWSEFGVLFVQKAFSQMGNVCAAEFRAISLWCKKGTENGEPVFHSQILIAQSMALCTSVLWVDKSPNSAGQYPGVPRRCMQSSNDGCKADRQIHLSWRGGRCCIPYWMRLWSSVELPHRNLVDDWMQKFCSDLSVFSRGIVCSGDKLWTAYVRVLFSCINYKGVRSAEEHDMYLHGPKRENPRAKFCWRPFLSELECFSARVHGHNRAIFFEKFGRQESNSIFSLSKMPKKVVLNLQHPEQGCAMHLRMRNTKRTKCR